MKTSLLMLAVLSVVTGCASVAVSGDKLETRTASAIGSAPGQFTITNRVDDGIRTDFYVQTKTGKAYNCYVTGTIGVVSDAICTPVATTTKQSTTKQPAPQEQAAKPIQQTTASTEQKPAAPVEQQPAPSTKQKTSGTKQKTTTSAKKKPDSTAEQKTVTAAEQKPAPAAEHNVEQKPAADAACNALLKAAGRC